MRAKDRPLANDFMSDADFEALLLAWFGNGSQVLRPGGGFYIWGGFMNLPNYPPALKASGLYFSQAVIWVKEHPVLTRKDFMGAHEQSPSTAGGRAPPTASSVHPTCPTCGRSRRPARTI